MNNVTSIPSAQAQKDRRVTQRFSASFPFSFTISEADKADLIGQKRTSTATNLSLADPVGQERTSEVANISLGGLSFETDLPLTVGSKLHLDLHLSISQRIQASGLVVRSEWVDRKKYISGSMIVRPVNSIGLHFQQFENDGRSVLMEHLEPEKSNPEGSVAEGAKGSNKISVSQLKEALQKRSQV